MKNENPDLPPDLQQLGARVKALPHEDVPAGLKQRTLARLEAALPERTGTKALEALKSAHRQSRRVVRAISRKLELLPWWRRPTYDPLARAAAMLFLLLTLGLVVYEPTAERLGRALEPLVPASSSDRIGQLVENILPSAGVQPEDDMNMDSPARPVNHKVKQPVATERKAV
jgi:hypothetical protein